MKSVYGIVWRRGSMPQYGEVSPVVQRERIRAIPISKVVRTYELGEGAHPVTHPSHSLVKFVYDMIVEA